MIPRTSPPTTAGAAREQQIADLRATVERCKQDAANWSRVASTWQGIAEDAIKQRDKAVRESAGARDALDDIWRRIAGNVSDDPRRVLQDVSELLAEYYED